MVDGWTELGRVGRQQRSPTHSVTTQALSAIVWGERAIEALRAHRASLVPRTRRNIGIAYRF